MQPDSLKYSRANCSIGAALDVIGEKWSLLVLRDVFLGLRRFDDILATVGCARSVLTARLATLVEYGILLRVPYHDPGSRPRFEYALTTKGRELYPILVSLLQWGDTWGERSTKPSVVLKHAGCNATVRAEIRCTKGHGPLQVSEIRSAPGPGAVQTA